MHPAVILLSSGVTSAFTLTLRDKNDARLSAALSTDGHSDIVVSEGDEKRQ